MALKDVKRYYKEMQEMYFGLLNDVKDMEKDLKEGNVTEEQFNSLYEPVSNIQNVYLILSHIMYLFSIPKRKDKAKRFKEKNSDLEQLFEAQGITEEQTVKESADALKEFKQNIKTLLKEKESD